MEFKSAMIDIYERTIMKIPDKSGYTMIQDTPLYKKSNPRAALLLSNFKMITF